MIAELKSWANEKTSPAFALGQFLVLLSGMAFANLRIVTAVVLFLGGNGLLIMDRINMRSK